MNKTKSLKWKTGTPKIEGLYFVALKLGEAAGHYDFLNWSDNSWELDYEQEVIAFIDYSDFISQLNIEWPEGQPDISAPESLPPDDELWEEA